MSVSSKPASRHMGTLPSTLRISPLSASLHCWALPALQGHIHTGVPGAEFPHCTSRHCPPMPRMVPSDMKVHSSLEPTLVAQLIDPSSQVWTAAPGLVEA